MADDAWKEQQRQLRRQMINDLSAAVRGFDRFGGPISMAEQRDAIILYEKIRAQEDAEARAWEAEARAKEAQALEGTKVENSYDIEQRKLDLEAERVTIQKAEVMVRALEVAAKAGIGGDQLLTLIGNFGNRLLPETASVLQLEKKDA